MEKTMSEKYGKMYDRIKEAAKENENPFLVLLMAKIYKTSRLMDFDYKKLHEELHKELGSVSNGVRAFDVDPDGFSQERLVMPVMEKLVSIKGVGCGVASAFLHFYNNKIPIIDKYSYAVFLKERKRMDSSEIKLQLKNKVFEVDDYHAFYKWYKKKYSNTSDHKDINFKLMEEGKKIL